MWFSNGNSWGNVKLDLFKNASLQLIQRWEEVCVKLEH